MKNLVILIAIIFSLAACQRIVETDSSLILVPPTKPGPAVVLIGLNGAFCDPHVYIGIFQTIQNYSNYTMWAALPKFPGDFPSNLDKAIPKTLNELSQQGANISTVFVVGHSLGGFMGQDFLAENATGIKGLVLLGKFMKFQYQDPQINFPVPVLTISGELDGLSKITRLAMSFNQMLRHPQAKGHLRFPVAIVPEPTTPHSLLETYQPRSMLQTSSLRSLTKRLGISLPHSSMLLLMHSCILTLLRRTLVPNFSSIMSMDTPIR